MFPDWDMWGWAFVSEGMPCVAHLVWAMPSVYCPSVLPALIFSSRLATLPFALYVSK